MEEYATYRKLIEYLQSVLKSELTFEDFVAYNRKLGVIEEQDVLCLDNALLRADAARIIHCFLKYVKKVEDEPSIEAAYVLRDIFDCHRCVAHIAEVYLKNIIPAKSGIDKTGNEYLHFGGRDRVDLVELDKIKERLDSFLM